MKRTISTMLFSTSMIVGMPSTAYSNDHLLPDITDFDTLYVGYRKAYSAQISAIKGKKNAGGKDEALRTELNQISLGLKKERVDNRYSIIGFGYSKSSNGELDYTNSEIIVQNHYSFKYGEGRHIGKSGKIDWNIYIAVEAGDYQLGFDTKSEIGLAIGGEIMYSITSWLDAGITLNLSNQYQAASLGGEFNF